LAVSIKPAVVGGDKRFDRRCRRKQAERLTNHLA
jgi:hypothetical protein